jgi:hypothetical protein
MILDAIVCLAVTLFEWLVLPVLGALVVLINLGAAALEIVVGLFVSGFKLGRLTMKKKEAAAAEIVTTGNVRTAGVTLGLIALVGMAAWLAPMVQNRTLTLVADDGHSLPYAALILHQSDGDVQKRTDNAGNIVVSRFSTQGVTIKDPRYVEQTWKDEEMTDQLVARRTILGSGLDVLAGELLKPALNKKSRN